MQFQSFFPTLNARMYLYDTPRDTMAKDPMLQSVCSTSTWMDPRIIPNTSNYLFMCFSASHSIQRYLVMCSRASRSTQIINHSSVPELLAQHKTSHKPCAPGSTPNTKKHIHISSIIGLHPIYKTNHHVHMQWGV